MHTIESITRFQTEIRIGNSDENKRERENIHKTDPQTDPWRKSPSPDLPPKKKRIQSGGGKKKKYLKNPKNVRMLFRGKAKISGEIWRERIRKIVKVTNNVETWRRTGEKKRKKKELQPGREQTNVFRIREESTWLHGTEQGEVNMELFSNETKSFSTRTTREKNI